MSGNAVLLSVVALEMLALMTPNRATKIAATAASVYSLVYFLFNKPEGSFMTIWPMGMNIWGLSNKCFNYMWLQDPAKMVRTEPNPKKESSEAEKPGIKSWMDAFDIAITARGVGWAFGAKGIPTAPPSSQSRLSFIYEQLQAVFLRFLVLDVVIYYANTYVQTLEGASLPLKLVFGAFMTLYVRWTMDIPYRVLASVSVAGFWSSPSDWPPLFGPWQEAYSVRRFWSCTWHQCMRITAEPPVNYLVNNILRLKRGSYWAMWTKIFGNFFIAYVLHAYGRVLAGGDQIYDWNTFMINALAIWVEETVRDAVYASGLVSKDWAGAKYVGYVWTALFETYMFLYFMEGAIRVHGSVPAPEIGLIEPVFGGISLARPAASWISSLS